MDKASPDSKDTSKNAMAQFLYRFYSNEDYSKLDNLDDQAKSYFKVSGNLRYKTYFPEVIREVQKRKKKAQEKVQQENFILTPAQSERPLSFRILLLFQGLVQSDFLFAYQCTKPE